MQLLSFITFGGEDGRGAGHGGKSHQTEGIERIGVLWKTAEAEKLQKLHRFRV